MTKLIIALDVSTLREAELAVDKLGDKVEWFKVGKQLFTSEGPAIVKMLKKRGYKVFLDLKFHDIPNTVAQAVYAALGIGADMVNFHATGGSEMIRTAVEKCRPDFPESELIAVTILTSMGQETLDEIQMTGTPAEAVSRLAGVANKGGADGIVCSAWEIEKIKSEQGKDFKVVVPGIRPAGAAVDDQKRIMTPGQAAALGADYIVVGRPIMKASNPAEAAESILAELREA